MEASIVIPAQLKQKAAEAATARGISLEEFICQTLRSALTERRADDPLFADRAIYEGNAPQDLSTNHDDYLYGDSS